jgi:hypothetical protein
MDCYDKETRAMIDEVLSDTDKDTQLELLKNILSFKSYRNMSVQEIFKSELKAKQNLNP